MKSVVKWYLSGFYKKPKVGFCSPVFKTLENVYPTPPQGDICLWNILFMELSVHHILSVLPIQTLQQAHVSKSSSVLVVAANKY